MLHEQGRNVFAQPSAAASGPRPRPQLRCGHSLRCALGGVPRVRQAGSPGLSKSMGCKESAARSPARDAQALGRLLPVLDAHPGRPRHAAPMRRPGSRVPRLCPGDHPQSTRSVAPVTGLEKDVMEANAPRCGATIAVICIMVPLAGAAEADLTLARSEGFPTSTRGTSMAPQKVHSAGRSLPVTSGPPLERSCPSSCTLSPDRDAWRGTGDDDPAGVIGEEVAIMASGTPSRRGEWARQGCPSRSARHIWALCDSFGRRESSLA